MKTQQIGISSIMVDEKIQQRADLNEDYIDELLVEITEGAVLPPLDVYDIDGELFLTDGFHRLKALLKAGVDTVEVNIFEGNERDAILHAVGANANHGLRRTNADKRFAVTTLLKDKEWGNWSDGVIARRCRVSQPFVSKIRNELTQNGFEWDSMRISADGRVLDTSNIGAKSHTEESEDSQAIEESGSSRSDSETTNNNENVEPHSSEENDVERSPEADSEDAADVASTNNDDFQSDGGVDETNSSDNEEFSTEAESSPDSDTDDEPEANDESSDQSEEGNSGSDGNDVDSGAHESTSADSDEEESIPASNSEERAVQDEEPETEISDDPSPADATDATDEDDSPAESRADDSQAASVDMSQTDKVQTLKARIAELENTIVEKDHRIEELEAENAEFQGIIQELEEKLMASDEYAESTEELSSSSIY